MSALVEALIIAAARAEGVRDGVAYRERGTFGDPARMDIATWMDDAISRAIDLGYEGGTRLADEYVDHFVRAATGKVQP